MIIADGSSVNSAPLYVALDRGYFKQEGLELTIQLYESGKEAMDALRAGKGDLATVADLPIMYAVREGARFRVIATLSEAIARNAVVARKDRGILSIGDLRGKRIGVPPRTASEYFLDLLLVFNRVPRQAVRLVPMPPDRIPGALKKGDIDAASLWHPNVESLQKLLGNNGNTFYGRDLYRMLWNLVGTESLVKAHPESIKRILRGLIRGEAFIRENPLEAQKITSRYLGLGKGLSGTFWNGYTFRVALSPLLLMNLEDQYRWAVRHESSEEKTVPNFLSYFYLEGLRAVRPDAVTILY
jgi:NitT/TauT family transport system substrate-binding protein